jgi:hypothetical protein
MDSEVMCATAKEVVAHSSFVTAVREHSSGAYSGVSSTAQFFHPSSVVTAVGGITLR